MTLAALLSAHGDDLPLDEGAAALAQMFDAACTIEAVTGDLDALAHATHLSPGTDRGRVLAHLNTLFFTRLGFAGDTETYHAVDNSLVHRVLARRRGMPITLCLLYAEVARRLGVDLAGVGFPGHFVLRPPDATVFIDVFHRGRVLGVDQMSGLFDHMHPGASVSDAAWTAMLSPIGNRAFLARIARNLVASCAQDQDAAGVVTACDAWLLLDPHPTAHRDRGLALAELGDASAAIDALATYLALAPTAEDAYAISLRLSALTAGSLR